MAEKGGSSGRHSRNEHIFESAVKCRVKIRNGQVVGIGEPRIKGCPLARWFEIPVDEISKAAVKKTIGQRIRSFGMSTARRKVISEKDFFGFAPAELLACGLRSGMVERECSPATGEVRSLLPTRPWCWGSAADCRA